MNGVLNAVKPCKSDSFVCDNDEDFITIDDDHYQKMTGAMLLANPVCVDKKIV
jgi:hypothetical protein